MVRSLLRFNPLAFPGRAPGFDPTHFASMGMSKGLGFSAICVGGNFIDLLSATAFTALATPPSPAVIGSLGLCGLVNSATNPGPVQTSGQSTLTPTALTMAAIVQFVGVGDNNSNTIVSTNNATGHFNQFGRLVSGGNQYFFNNSSSNSSYSLSNNVPYFIASSALSSSTVNHVATNLLTGQVFSTATSTGASLGASSSSPRIGEDFGSGHFAAGYIAAAMMSVSFMPMAKLLAWAADPWAFWYPRTLFHSFDWLRGSIASTIALHANLGILVKGSGAPTGSAAIAARGNITTQGRGAPTGKTPIAGHMMLSSGAKAQADATAALVADLAAQTKGQGNPAGAAPLSARATMSASARASQAHSLALRALLSIATKANASASGAAHLAGRLSAQAKAMGASAGHSALAGLAAIKAGAGSALAGRAALSAAASIKTAARGVLTGAAPLVGLVATGTAQVKAFAQMTITAAKLIADPRFVSRLRNRNKR
jgi:hypothetical protein